MHSSRTLTAIAIACLRITTIAGEVSVEKVTYHGWDDCLILKNSVAEVVIVPAVGRVMQFRFTGEEDGAFWENRALDGKAPDPKSKEWGNFGGDKTWPSPQSDWPKVTDRAWPPPPAFDSMPVEAQSVAKPTTKGVLLKSPVDPFYGIRTERLIMLDPDKAVMEINTTYYKVEGEPRKVGIWTITQLKDPVDVLMPVSKDSAFKDGYNKQSTDLPMGIRLRYGGLLTMKRDRTKNTKIGNDASALYWIGERSILKIETPRVADAEYPDQGSSAEVYTNADPLPYVELELLGPLHTMKVGDRIEKTMTYTLSRAKEDLK
jgi:hypothetical protein